jgi:NAD(P)-dependent dehydrogenase (short-subunit alcohol dehydrogenase family)
MNTATQVAIVTGASTGIGRATALLLGEKGFKVYGTARRVPDIAITGVTMLAMDVRDEASVRSVVKRILDEEGRIDLLVNNAGVARVAAAEETTPEEALDLFQTNVFGLMRVTNAVLPSMRSRRAGRIVNLSSVLGFMPAPFMSAYAASKHAVQGYTESLDHELRALGIRAVSVQPAFTRSNLAVSDAAADPVIADYAAHVKAMRRLVNQSIANGEEPDAVAAVVLNAAEAPDPKPSYTAGRRARKLSWLRMLVPARSFAKSLRKNFRPVFNARVTVE